MREATEHTLRPALHNLLIALTAKAAAKITVIPEPKRDESGKGAPDVKFKIDERILGYLESKKVETNLDQTLKSEQIAKYKQLSNNLISPIFSSGFGSRAAPSLIARLSPIRQTWAIGRLGWMLTRQPKSVV